MTSTSPDNKFHDLPATVKQKITGRRANNKHAIQELEPEAQYLLPNDFPWFTEAMQNAMGKLGLTEFPRKMIVFQVKDFNPNNLAFYDTKSGYAGFSLPMLGEINNAYSQTVQNQGNDEHGKKEYYGAVTDYMAGKVITQQYMSRRNAIAKMLSHAIGGVTGITLGTAVSKNLDTSTAFKILSTAVITVALHQAVTRNADFELSRQVDGAVFDQTNDLRAMVDALRTLNDYQEQNPSGNPSGSNLTIHIQKIMNMLRMGEPTLDSRVAHAEGVLAKRGRQNDKGRQ